MPLSKVLTPPGLRASVESCFLPPADVCVGVCSPCSALRASVSCLQSLVAFPKLKRQVLLYEPLVSSPKDFAEGTLFSVNQDFSLM